MEITEYCESTHWRHLVINKITFTESFTWLKEGWNDFLKAKSYRFVHMGASRFVHLAKLIFSPR